ncbi:MAG TPA: hypothetical protein VLV83_24395 [Acidobacteriota bacterium]|nr:hypothetical protein [Acidobacteriota bacterium]
MLEIILDKRIWLVVATIASFSALTVHVIRQGRGMLPRMQAAIAFHLFFGLWFAVLGAGHLVAITIKSLTVTLPDDTGLLFLVPFGLGLALPGFLMLLSLPGIADLQSSSCRSALAADIWLVVLFALTVPYLAVVPAAGLILMSLLVEDYADPLYRRWTQLIRKSPTQGRE